MNYIEAKYLKATGKTLDTKVSINNIAGEYVIHIRDFELKDFSRTLDLLRNIGQFEIARPKDENEEAQP